MQGAVLAKVDRMSMQHSLEVRCPLLDVAFGETAMGLSEEDCWAPPTTTKLILKDIATDYLPYEWMHRSKKGFGLPANSWGMTDMLGLCRSVVASPNAALCAFLDHKVLSNTVEAQGRPGQFSIYQMWPLVMLELWLKAQPAKRMAARKQVAALEARQVEA
jgi:asparagine synthase (glutamine-hydrolysing)